MTHKLDFEFFFPGIDDVSSTTANNVNGSSKRSPNSSQQHTTLPRSFQYETFHVFNWDDYLAVSI